MAVFSYIFLTYPQRMDRGKGTIGLLDSVEDVRSLGTDLCKKTQPWEVSSLEAEVKAVTALVRPLTWCSFRCILTLPDRIPTD